MYIKRRFLDLSQLIGISFLSRTDHAEISEGGLGCGENWSGIESLWEDLGDIVAGVVVESEVRASRVTDAGGEL